MTCARREPPVQPRLASPEPPGSRPLTPHRESVEVFEDVGGVRIGDEADSDGGFEDRCGLVGLGARASEALASIVTVACGCLGEVEVGAEEGASWMVWPVAAWELSDDGTAGDEDPLGESNASRR